MARGLLAPIFPLTLLVASCGHIWLDEVAPDASADATNPDSGVEEDAGGNQDGRIDSVDTGEDAADAGGQDAGTDVPSDVPPDVMPDIGLDTAFDGGLQPTPLARWRINEASTGQGPAMLFDDTANPVNLSLAYVDESPIWNAMFTGRRLTFGGTGVVGERIDTGGAFALTNGTKLDAIDGATTFTIETMHEYVECNGLDARVFQLGDGDDPADGWVSVRQDNDIQVFAIRFAEAAEWNQLTPVDVPTRCLTGSHVVHWIVDTTAALESDRVRLILDGVPTDIVSVIGPTIEQGWTASLGPNERRVSIGRAHSGIRSLYGDIDFVAIYDRALTIPETATRATFLMLNSD